MSHPIAKEEKQQEWSVSQLTNIDCTSQGPGTDSTTEDITMKKINRVLAPRNFFLDGHKHIVNM